MSSPKANVQVIAYLNGVQMATGVTDANEILKELGTPGSLEFLDSTGYTAFSQGNDYTPLLTGSDVKAAQAYTDTNSREDTPYGVQLTVTYEG